MRRARIWIVAVTLCALPAAAARAAEPTATPPLAGLVISIHATPATIAPGKATTISGKLVGSTGPGAAELVELQIYARRFAHFVNIAHTRTAADGDYRFAPLRLDRDTRLRVVDVGGGGRTGPTVEVIVEEPEYPSSRRVIAAAHYIARRAG